MNILDLDGVVKPASAEFIAQRELDAQPVPPTPADVIAERERRPALGFDYDFGDARGVHHRNLARRHEGLGRGDHARRRRHQCRRAGDRDPHPHQYRPGHHNGR